MFGIGETELVIIVVFSFLLFGPDKLPGMGRTLGRVLRQFREASDGFTEVVQTNIMDPASEELEKSPKQRRREEAAALDADADVDADGGAQDASESAAPARRETFAERKARLKAEREAAAAQEESAVERASEEATTAVVDAPAASEDEPEPAHTSAQDLYATTTRHSSRYQAREKETEGAQSEAEPSTIDEDASSTATTSGEEDGSSQA